MKKKKKLIWRIPFQNTLRTSLKDCSGSTKNYLETSILIFSLWVLTQTSLKLNEHDSEISILKVKYSWKYKLKKFPKTGCTVFWNWNTYREWTHCILETNFFLSKYCDNMKNDFSKILLVAPSAGSTNGKYFFFKDKLLPETSFFHEQILR